MTDHAHHTINPTRNGEAIVDEIGNSIRADAAGDDYTADALRALAELDAHGKDHIEFMLRFGEALAKAKRSLKHGDFTKWCKNILKRSPSWCSSHRRLFESRRSRGFARLGEAN